MKFIWDQRFHHGKNLKHNAFFKAVDSTATMFHCKSFKTSGRNVFSRRNSLYEIKWISPGFSCGWFVFDFFESRRQYGQHSHFLRENSQLLRLALSLDELLLNLLGTKLRRFYVEEMSSPFLSWTDNLCFVLNNKCQSRIDQSAIYVLNISTDKLQGSLQAFFWN